MEKEYKLVIFDMDGTFLDSRGKGEIAHEWAYEAFRKTLRFYGITLSIEEIDTLFLAPLHSDGEEGVRRFCDRFRMDCEAFWGRRERDVIEAKIEAIRKGEITLCRDSEAVIDYLSKSYSLAVVSDSQQECVDYVLEHFNLKPYFKIWYGRRSELECLANRKPNPYYINRVLSELKMSKRAAILVDDSPVGVLAAMRAGIESVFIYNNGERGISDSYKPTFLVKAIGDLGGVL